MQVSIGGGGGPKVTFPFFPLLSFGSPRGSPADGQPVSAAHDEAELFRSFGCIQGGSHWWMLSGKCI